MQFWSKLKNNTSLIPTVSKSGSKNNDKRKPRRYIVLYNNKPFFEDI